jgi:pimeloyl-ACP methyl ester carboxylesterase
MHGSTVVEIGGSEMPHDFKRGLGRARLLRWVGGDEDDRRRPGIIRSRGITASAINSGAWLCGSRWRQHLVCEFRCGKPGHSAPRWSRPQRQLGHQVPDLIAAGHRVIVIDSRGHGRSTRDARPFAYELMASDVLAVMDRLGVERAALVGWSDGAIIALITADRAPERVTGVFFFACKMDPSGNKVFEPSPIQQRCFSRHGKDYAALSATPETFKDFVGAVSLMQRTQPNYSLADLARIQPPVRIVHAEHDEFIKSDHAAYLAKSIPNATLTILPDVSHFAPLQRPDQFNAELQDFLGTITRT